MGFPKEMGAAFTQFTTSAIEQTNWKEVLGSATGHVNNPGIKTEAGIMFQATARLVGVDGHIDLRAKGEGTRLPDDVRVGMIAHMNSIQDCTSDECNAIRERLLIGLGWSKTQPAPGPVDRTPTTPNQPVATDGE